MLKRSFLVWLVLMSSSSNDRTDGGQDQSASCCKNEVGWQNMPSDSTYLAAITQAEQFLILLGKDPAKTWFRTIKCAKGANHSRGGRDLCGFNAKVLDAENKAGSSIYFITGDADTATCRNRDGHLTGCVGDADITVCRSLFAEWDDQPIEWQLQAWQELALPEPSVVVTTGGKSAHVYWVLEKPLEPNRWRDLQRKLLVYCKADASICNPSRLMRLPGFAYIDKKTGKPNGNFAEVVNS